MDKTFYKNKITLYKFFLNKILDLVLLKSVKRKKKLLPKKYYIPEDPFKKIGYENLSKVVETVLFFLTAF